MSINCNLSPKLNTNRKISIMTQGVLPYKYEKENTNTDMTVFGIWIWPKLFLTRPLIPIAKFGNWLYSSAMDKTLFIRWPGADGI